MEQLVGLKKQLEKKLADAYEEVEEQRQVVAQWKRKNQKMTNEMNDLRMLLDEQNSRNNLLEKRQRKFDSECQALQVIIIIYLILIGYYYDLIIIILVGYSTTRKAIKRKIIT